MNWQKQNKSRNTHWVFEKKVLITITDKMEKDKGLMKYYKNNKWESSMTLSFCGIGEDSSDFFHVTVSVCGNLIWYHKEKEIRLLDCCDLSLMDFMLE